MSKRPFQANQWLFSQTSVASKASVHHYGQSSSNEINNNSRDFSLNNYLIPSWKGDSLPSKYSSKFRLLLQRINQDVITQFENTEFNKTLKNSIYLEYVSYCKKALIENEMIKGQAEFWSAVRESHDENGLKQFRSCYAQKITIIYLLKIRFLVLLFEKIGMRINDSNLLLPNSTFTQIFKRGSSTELKCEAFHSNHYSWYLPKFDIFKVYKNLTQLFNKISIPELNKLFYADSSIKEFDSDKFSHSLSNVHVGNFINLLIKDIPGWIKGDRKTLGLEQFKVQNCKFTGDNLESLSVSHWLASTNYNQDPEETVICPEFIVDEQSGSLFTKLSHELEFLTNLIINNNSFDESPVSFLCQIYRKKERSFKENLTQQFLFHQKFLGQEEIQYDLTLLNLTEFPKNNAHFYLINKINDQIESIKEGAHLIVLSAKKLFIPSQTGRIDGLLEKLKVLACFTLDQLKGKGELAPYIYIFEKSTNQASKIKHFSTPSVIEKEGKEKKHPCFSLRLSGELSTIHKFEVINKGIQNFITTKKSEATSMFQKDFDGQFVFEFYQDAIVEGRLINTSKKDTTKITHPNFFRNILKASLPLNHYFIIEQVNGEKAGGIRNDLLGINVRHEQRYDSILILDVSNPHRPRIEIISRDQYISKLNDYGEAYFYYFGLIPKVKHMNLNIFRSFFDSTLGQQIIQVSVSSAPSKIKSKVESILVPRFFGQIKFLPEAVENSLSFLQFSSQNISSVGINSIVEKFEQTKHTLYHLSKDYPWHTLGLMIHFEEELDKIKQSNTCNILEHLSNPVVQKWFSECNKAPLFPSNEDIYCEFHVTHKQELMSKITNLEIEKQDKSGKEVHVLNVFNQCGKVASFYSTSEILQFLQFLMDSAKHLPLIEILQYTEIPTMEEFDKITSLIKNEQEGLTQLESSIKDIIDNIFKSQISLSL